MSLRSILVALLLVILPTTATAGKLRYKHLAQEFVSMWYFEERATNDEQVVMDGLRTFPGASAYVRHDLENNSVAIYSQDRQQPVVHFVPIGGHESEAINYVLRYYGYRTVFALTEDATMVEMLQPHALHSVAYVNNDYCETNLCDGTFTVVMMEWANPRFE